MLADATPASDSAARERSPLAWCTGMNGIRALKKSSKEGGEEWGVGGDRGVSRVVMSSSTLCILESTSEVGGAYMKGCEVCVVDTRDTTAGGASRPCSLGVDRIIMMAALSTLFAP